MSGTPPVAGYRQLSPAEVGLANQNKLMEELILRQAEVVRATEGVDGRWASIAITHFQEGFMALNRAIFQPQRLSAAIPTEDLFKGVSK